jgi:hypothetical protein
MNKSQAGYCDYENSSIYINSGFDNRNIILIKTINGAAITGRNAQKIRLGVG